MITVKTTYKALLIVLVLISTLGLASSVPTSGDFVNRTANVWSLDIVSTTTAGPSQMSCFLAKLRPELNVNKGPYVAKVNWDTCSAGTASSPSDLWWIATVNVISNSNNVGYTAQVWITAQTKSAITTNLPEIFYFNYSVTNAASANLLNGVFTLNGCQSSSLSNDCSFKLFASSDGTILQVGVNSSRLDPSLGPLGSYLRLTASVSANSGYGAIITSSVNADSSSASGRFATNEDLYYSYSGNDAAINIIDYKMGDPSQPLWDVAPAGQSCIDRTPSNLVMNVFNYEVYKADGSRYTMDHPQVPYRIVDANNQFILDPTSSNQLGGRIMVNPDNNLTTNYFPFDPTLVTTRIDRGETLFAQTWLGGAPNYNLPIRIDPSDSGNFQILDMAGNPYQESPALGFSVNLQSGNTITGLLDTTLEGTRQTYYYMGNGYIWNIPWDSTNGFNFSFLNGAQVTGLDGLPYFIRPMFYSLTPPTIATCATSTTDLLPNARDLHAQIPSGLTFTSNPSANWIDPRTLIGAVLNPSSTSYKYIDGVAQ